MIQVRILLQTHRFILMEHCTTFRLRCQDKKCLEVVALWNSLRQGTVEAQSLSTVIAGIKRFSENKRIDECGDQEGFGQGIKVI